MLKVKQLEWKEGTEGYINCETDPLYNIVYWRSEGLYADTYTTMHRDKSLAGLKHKLQRVYERRVLFAIEGYDPNESTWLETETVIHNLKESNTLLREAVENAKGLLATPIARRRYGDDSFYKEVIESIEKALEKTNADA